ncbi:ferredoxin [Nocardia sp. NPDC052566]|uniref:ferredoxin n=1 Tax=Nocardia sp. NPDC052566 TaxID=3364330 RepID=UPI0037C6B08B
MRILVDRKVCDGHSQCEALAPTLFRVGDDGIVAPLVDVVADRDREVVELAVDSCPVQALRLE